MDLDFVFDFNQGDNKMNILLKGEDGEFHAEYHDNFLFVADVSLDMNVKLSDQEKERLFGFINYIPNVDEWINEHPKLTNAIENDTLKDDYENLSPEEQIIAKLYLEYND